MSTVEDELKLLLTGKRFAIPCRICFSSMPIYGIVQDMTQLPICEECLRRLNKMLYPEKAESKEET